MHTIILCCKVTSYLAGVSEGNSSEPFLPEAHTPASNNLVRSGVSLCVHISWDYKGQVNQYHRCAVLL